MSYRREIETLIAFFISLVVALPPHGTGQTTYLPQPGGIDPPLRRPSGDGPELTGYIASGLGRVFSSLAVVILSGTVIAEYLRMTGPIDRIISDLIRASRGRSMAVSEGSQAIWSPSPPCAA